MSRFGTLIACVLLITSCSDEEHPVFTADVFGYESWASRTHWDILTGSYACDDSYWVLYASQTHPTTNTVSLGYIIVIKKSLLAETSVPIELSYDDCDYRIFEYRGTDDRFMTLARMNYDYSGEITRVTNGKVSGHFQAGTGASVDGPVKFEIRELLLNVESVVNNCFDIYDMCRK